MNTIRFGFFCLCALSVLASTQTAFASTLSFKVTHNNDIQYKAVVLLNTEGQTINTISSSMVLPASVHLEKISVGNSPVSLWVKKPTTVENGAVYFSGLIPGGIISDEQELFSFTFTIEALQEPTLVFGETSILRNDGYGTPTPVSLLEKYIRADTIPKTIESDLIDTELPELFIPILSRSELSFDGKYFVSFQTQDKESGVVSYRLTEGLFDWYKNVESPYVLKYQSLDRNITIQAVDDSGNIRTAVLLSEHPLVWYRYPESIAVSFSAILLTVFGIVFFLYRRTKNM